VNSVSRLRAEPECHLSEIVQAQPSQIAPFKENLHGLRISAALDRDEPCQVDKAQQATLDWLIVESEEFDYLLTSFNEGLRTKKKEIHQRQAIISKRSAGFGRYFHWRRNSWCSSWK
jgi:hypothetical protein